MNKKYKTLSESQFENFPLHPERERFKEKGEEVELFQIKALCQIGEVAKRHQLGGFMDESSSLDETGSCWIDEKVSLFDSTVKHNATIQGRVIVTHSALLDNVSVVSPIGFDEKRNVPVHYVTTIYDSELLGNTSLLGSIEVIGSTLKDCYIEGNLTITDSELMKPCVVYGDLAEISDYCTSEINGEQLTVFKDRSDEFSVHTFKQKFVLSDQFYLSESDTIWLNKNIGIEATKNLCHELESIIRNYFHIDIPKVSEMGDSLSPKEALHLAAQLLNGRDSVDDLFLLGERIYREYPYFFQEMKKYRRD